MFPTVTFATTCWKKDWRRVLLEPGYLEIKQIAFHQFPFSERLLVINNVENLDLVKEAAQEKIDKNILDRFVVAEDVLSSFQLERSDFNDWQYYNALGPLNAIYHCKSEYLLFLTGDVYLDSPIRWIEKAIRCMQKNPEVKVANLLWNDLKKEAKKESYRKSWNFYFSHSGFSDQMFLVRRSDFFADIYREIREDAMHFPRGDVWEKRTFSYMKNHGWIRITYKGGSYIHENVTW